MRRLNYLHKIRSLTTISWFYHGKKSHFLYAGKDESIYRSPIWRLIPRNALYRTEDSDV